MATECIVMGENIPVKVTPIVFVHYLSTEVELGMSESRIQDAETEPNEFDCIELIQAARSTEGYDILFAYDKGARELGNLYLGYWNDGFVKKD